MILPSKTNAKNIIRYVLCGTLIVAFIFGFSSSHALAADSPSLWQKTKNYYNSLKDKLTGVKRTSSWIDKIKALVELRKNPNAVVKGETAGEKEIRVGQAYMNNRYRDRGLTASKDYVKAHSARLDKMANTTRQRMQGENGSMEFPYYIEPNQFKKICDKNEYVLYWRIAGASGRDMADPTGSGGPTGEESIWRLPTCAELAQCHCCMNTCDDTVFRKVPVQGGWVEIIVCLPNVGFGPQPCNPMCKVPIGRTACMAYTSPTHDAIYNRDCMGRINGCEGNIDDCVIKIMDPNYSQLWYTGSPSSQAFIRGNAGVNVLPPGVRVKKDNGADALGPGWIGQLEGDKGKCCKCIQY